MNRDQVVFQLAAGASQAQLQASDLRDAALQSLHRIGVCQELFRGISAEQFVSELQ